MKKLQLFSKHLILALVAIFMVASCGGGTPTAGSQFTLDVQGMVTVGDPSTLSLGKAIDNPETQVLIGTMILEVQDNFFDDIGVDFNFNVIDFEATAETDSAGEIQLVITPNTVGSATLFKEDEFGELFGTNQVNVDTTVVIPNATGADLMLGELNFVATNAQQAARLPLLGDIPALNYLFLDQNKQAQITELVVLLTPELIKVLE